jgi:hypothetical protein
MGAIATIMATGNGKIYIPLKPIPGNIFEVIAEGPTPGSIGEKIQTQYSETDAKLTITMTPNILNKLLYVVPKPQ